MLLSSNQVLRYVNALAVAADGLPINNVKPAEGAHINNILTIFGAGAWPQMDQTLTLAHLNMIFVSIFYEFHQSVFSFIKNIEI